MPKKSACTQALYRVEWFRIMCQLESLKSFLSTCGTTCDLAWCYCCTHTFKTCGTVFFFMRAFDNLSLPLTSHLPFFIFSFFSISLSLLHHDRLSHKVLREKQPVFPRRKEIVQRATKLAASSSHGCWSILHCQSRYRKISWYFRTKMLHFAVEKCELEN